MRALVQSLGDLLPDLFQGPLQQQLEQALPLLRVSLARLALEVVAAEAAGVSYYEAVDRTDYPLMARIHFGVLDQLQSRPPPELRATMRTVIERADAGDFDPVRKLLFEIASRKDAEAALARFLLFQIIRLNLYINTWEEPLFEVWGSLARVEKKAESVLRELLALDEMHHRDVRPLHVLVKEMLMHLQIDADLVRQRLNLNLFNFIEKDSLLADAHAAVRALDARDAAVFRPGRSKDKMGSQRIADRYPHHFSSPNAVDQRRHRLRRRRDEERVPTSSGERLIDVMLDVVKDKE